MVVDTLLVERISTGGIIRDERVAAAAEMMKLTEKREESGSMIAILSGSIKCRIWAGLLIFTR